MAEKMPRSGNGNIAYGKARIAAAAIGRKPPPSNEPHSGDGTMEEFHRTPNCRGEMPRIGNGNIAYGKARIAAAAIGCKPPPSNEPRSGDGTMTL